MIKIVAGLLLAATLTACATSKSTSMPSGAAGFVVSCDGTVLSFGNCYSKAGELCPAGYAIIDKSREVSLYLGAQVVARNLIIECNSDEDRM